jgi:hypothetical protein
MHLVQLTHHMIRLRQCWLKFILNGEMMQSVFIHNAVGRLRATTSVV